ncbi:hypothetical protein M2347_001519 [Chryseobacterium sp. H1D6B]|uniref:hypothetical protein n=1 Tax=Chryseobacterium sp. H1D6B TaxID=2940588 RepID=UPI0015CB41AE|nr:hypothetical protein [Chryseobacterium sp. H1D6B]MDH6251792.1 hypothetical protein [Chryseobacterium sp. H1D6B]
MKNIDIRNLAGIGVADVDVYKTNKKKLFVFNTIYFIKVRLKNPYNGEFGFDWIDVDPSTGEIQKIQGVDFSNLEYFYKKPITPNNPRDLGNIIQTTTDLTGAKNLVNENYKTLVKPGQITDVPWVFIKPGQEIELALEINLTSTAAITTETINITGDDFYEFEIVDGIKNGKKTEKQIPADKKPLTLKIKCLKAAPEKEYGILQESPGSTPFTVGGFKMMENKIQKLKFRVIANVSSDNSPAVKAKDLFQKFIQSDIVNYLNNNSLNQAGYEVEIENQVMLDNLATADLDDFYYSFDKTDWTNKKYFAVVGSKGVLAENQNEIGGPDKSNMLDNLIFEEYQKKLRGKSKTYDGGVILLNEYQSAGNTGAYSRTSPLNHYKLLVFSTNIEDKITYAHEISHMLGLPHLFFKTAEEESYKSARTNIIGNGLPESDNKYIPGVLKLIKDTQISSSSIFASLGITAKKSSLTTGLNNLISQQQRNYDDNKRDRESIKSRYSAFPDSYKINATQTKGQYIAACNSNMQISEERIEANKKAKIKLNKEPNLGYVTLEPLAYFLKRDYLIILGENYLYRKIVIKQVHDNYLMFKQSSTQNIMDYYSNGTRYLHNQIKIMRDDIKNYLPL